MKWNSPFYGIESQRGFLRFHFFTHDGVRLLLSGKTSSGRIAMPDGRQPVPGGWNFPQPRCI